MNSDFPRTLALLRREKGISQRQAAKELGISQALLSHYENGMREPGLAFVVRACDFYNVSADFLLGRTLSRDGTTIVDADTLYDASAERDATLRGSIMATLSKKLLVNSVSMLFDLLGKCGNREAIRAASEYLSTAVYQLFRHLYQSPGTQSEEFFSVPQAQFSAGVAGTDMVCSQVDYVDALNAHRKEKGTFPDMSHEALSREYPGVYQSLLQIIHTTGERINRQVRCHREAGKK
ncbi:MAG: helix-turn-helix transcriptional regulator [Oscillospiraceae bacterium]|nr:helix-turn-helix transcriptional regulator [Oscillospiraceae bacterium]